MVDITTERELHTLILTAIQQGRWLAEDWLGSGFVPKGTTKRLVLESLEQLRGRNGLEHVDDERMELFGEQIRRFLNSHREGVGDQALDGHVDTTWEQDEKVIELVNLSWRWKQFRCAKRDLEDKLAAIRDTERKLESI